MNEDEFRKIERVAGLVRHKDGQGRVAGSFRAVDGRLIAIVQSRSGRNFETGNNVPVDDLYEEPTKEVP